MKTTVRHAYKGGSQIRFKVLGHRILCYVTMGDYRKPSGWSRLDRLGWRATGVQTQDDPQRSGVADRVLRGRLTVDAIYRLLQMLNTGLEVTY